MTDNEFLLEDRLGVIRDTIKKHGEENFYLSFSGGKDSTVVHHLLDMAIPDNKIPRVFANTGIEYNDIIMFVKELAKKDDRVVMIRPQNNIKKILEENGYPFKSKMHSQVVCYYQNKSENKMIHGYLGERSEYWHSETCPQILRYQFTEENKLKISDKCCIKLKEEPLKKYAKENNKKIAIIGIMREEGGRRRNVDCLLYKHGKLIGFHPLSKVTKEWEDWFIEEKKIEICKLYNEPYNFTRTGCKGCPFNINIQKELDKMEELLPSERKQCEYIWKPVYKEYRRLGYRLDNEEQMKLF